MQLSFTPGDGRTCSPSSLKLLLTFPIEFKDTTIEMPSGEFPAIKYLLDGGPAEGLGHGHDRDGHVHLVKVAEHEGAEQGENHGPALLLAALGHVETDVLGDGVRDDGTTTAGGDDLGVTALGLHDGRGARDGGDRGDTHAHGRFAGDLNSRNRGGADGANGTARGCAGTGEHGSLSRHSRHDEGHFSPTYADRRSYDVE